MTCLSVGVWLNKCQNSHMYLCSWRALVSNSEQFLSVWFPSRLGPLLALPPGAVHISGAEDSGAAGKPGHQEQRQEKKQGRARRSVPGSAATRELSHFGQVV